MRFRISLCTAAMALLILPGLASAAGPDAREATLNGASEVPAVTTAATGEGWVIISSDNTTVTYFVEYSGLSGALAAAHIHTGAPGVAGGVILPLAAGPSPMFGTLTSADFKPSGSVTTFAEALAAIRGGTTYFNLHTAANPGGEIRGQIVAAAAPTPTGTQPATSTESPIDPNGAGSALPALTVLFIVAAVGVFARGRRHSSRRTR